MFNVRAALGSLIIASLPSGFAQESSTTIATPTEEAGATMLGGVAAVVNDEIISIADVGQRARMILLTIGAPVNQENLQQALPRALEELIDEILQLQKASEYDVVIDDREIDSSMERMAAQNGNSLQDFYSSLEASGINPETLKGQMRAEIAWQRIMNGLYGSRIRISPLQIDGMLDRLTDSIGEERYQLSEIFLYAPNNADKEQAIQAAGVIVQQLAQGARFQLAAQQYSNAATAAVGGDLGWVSLTEVDPEAQDIIRNTPAPALTQPIVVEDGIYIYAVRGVQAPSELQFSYSLKQLIGSDSTSASLSAVTLDNPGCDDLETVSSDNGLLLADLGTVSESDLADNVKFAVSSVGVGEPTSVIQTPAGPSVVFVCDKTQSGVELPSRSQLEDRLFNKQLSLLSERDLRDLKREATVIRR